MDSNKWNADQTTIRFGFHTRKLLVAVPATMRKCREIEYVGSKKHTLPHSVKYACILSAAGSSGHLVLLFKVKLEWFSKELQAEHKRISSSSVRTTASASSASSSDTYAAQLVKMLKKSAAKFMNLTSEGSRSSHSQPVADDQKLQPQLVILADTIIYKLPVPGLGVTGRYEEVGYLWFATHTANPAVFKQLYHEHHIPCMLRHREAALSPYQRLFVSYVLAIYVVMSVHT